MSSQQSHHPQHRGLISSQYGPLIPPAGTVLRDYIGQTKSSEALKGQEKRNAEHHNVRTRDSRDSYVSNLPKLLNEKANLTESSVDEKRMLANQKTTTKSQNAFKSDPEEGSNSRRRCLSNKDMRSFATLPGSPYSYMLFQKEQISSQMTERFQQMKEYKDDLSGGSSRATALTNKARNERRAEHNRAITSDLCEIVADLFMAESKLLNPSKYGVESSTRREHILRSIERFVGSLPLRYALGAETPSEVLLHMRLVAAVKSDPTRAVVHISSLDDVGFWKKQPENFGRQRKLVTVSCMDANGLLEYVTKILATGGSRVLDADVMLSSDNVVLDRFVVEMHGRLRLDKLSQLIEKFLQKCRPLAKNSNDNSAPESDPSSTVYFKPSPSRKDVHDSRATTEELKAAVPLSEVVASRHPVISALVPFRTLSGEFTPLTRHLSIPRTLRTPVSQPESETKRDESNVVALDAKIDSNDAHAETSIASEDKIEVVASGSPTANEHASDLMANDTPRTSGKRQLIKRPANSDFDAVEQNLDVCKVESMPRFQDADDRTIPLIPFDELMLIETLGMGRVSTIYRAAWKNSQAGSYSNIGSSTMVALKVAMVNKDTFDMSHVDELQREADIASRLRHPNICDLKGVAADSECFCLAYEFCEGGSLLSLLSDGSRYYEYLPIALDVANGMAYLHSRHVIHRDLKPSNILLTRDHRAKIADFGMSVANAGQELTAETGTYRYMAPEVIRHESYSSNADVYSFGICLWQLITREVPFATMTPIQAAYAVAEGRRPVIPESTPQRLRDIISACWDQDATRRPSFTYIAMALADYAKMAFSPANVGTNTLQIANDMLANVEGNSTVNVDFSAPVILGAYMEYEDHSAGDSDIGLEI